MSNKSLLNVIPFGDWTEREIDSAADLFGVDPDEMYEVGQAPVRDVPVSKRNPLIPGVNTRFWVPMANAFVPVNPMADASRMVATSQDLRKMQRALAQVAVEVRRVFNAMTEAEWVEREETRIQKHIANARNKGKKPDPRKMKVRPFAEAREAYRKSAYWTEVRKLINWLSDPARKTPPFEVFTEGSKKLPFFQWSTVPGATCPGAGKCWDKSPADVEVDPEGRAFRRQQSLPNEAYCYSLSGWRHVVPFLRQLQNTVLTRLLDKSHILRAMNKVSEDGRRKGEQRVVRLFVDGDFDSMATLEFWMHICDRFPDLSFYGYSKSWDLFVEYDKKRGGVWPPNYVLNLSNGTMWEKLEEKIPGIYRKKIDEMMKISCVRGRFIAIKGVKSTMPPYTEKMAKEEVDPRTVPGHREHMRDVLEEAERQRERFGIVGKMVSCPGKCFACVGPTYSGDPQKKEAGYGKHMCGMSKLKGVNIIIAVH